MASSATVAGIPKYRGAAGQHAQGATSADHSDESGRAPAVTLHAQLNDLLRDRHRFFPSQRWFAVHCQARRGQVATTQLRNQGFRVFLPLRVKSWRHARRREMRQVPFFPGYTFIAFNPERDRWRTAGGLWLSDSPGVR